MNRTTFSLTLALCVSVLLAHGADRFVLVRSIVAGGGVVNSGTGNLTLSGTIGQPDAGVLTGSYTVTGGGWFKSAALIFAPKKSGTNLVFSFETEPGPTYVVEYTTSLLNPNWQPLSTSSGDGSVKTITEPAITGTRFYRVREQ